MSNFFAVVKDRFKISRKVAEAYFVALMLLVAAFPDVIFKGASLRLTDQITAAFTGVPLKPFYPIPNTTGWWAGYNDNGGATYQSEPMIQFMTNSVRDGDSPYWNPYSTAGALGPEALVDQKFSAMTLANAFLGGGSLTYNIVILIGLFFGVFFIYRIVREVFGLSAVAAFASSTFYLLNGYITANLGSNVTQSYLYVPLCLYGALLFVSKISVARWSVAVLAFALFFTCTFMPTTITSLIVIGCITIGYMLNCVTTKQYSMRTGLIAMSLLGLALISSFVLLAPLYFPFLENLKSLGTLDDYSKRHFWPLSFPNAIPSFFSSSHLFESYNGAEPSAAMFNNSGSFTGNTVFHSGVIAIALASCVLSKRLGQFRWLIGISLGVTALVLVRLFDPVWIQLLFAQLPIIGNIGSQYWWPVIMFFLTFMIGFGIHNLQERNARILPWLALLTLGVGTLMWCYSAFGLQEPHLEYKISALTLLALASALMLSLLLFSKYIGSGAALRGVCTGVVMLMFIELMLMGKMIRFQRNDLFANLPPALQFVKQNIGVSRTLNFGQRGLYPELGSAFQIQEVSTMNQGGLPEFRDFFYSVINLEGRQRLGYHPTTPLGSFPSLILIQDTPEKNIINWQAMNFLGVKYVLLPLTYTAYEADLKSRGFKEVYQSLETRVMENMDVLPRAFAISTDGLAEKNNPALPADYAKHVVPVSIDSYHNARVKLSGSTDKESLIVLSDTWHSNWSAKLNGKKVPIVKVDNVFRGVVVPAGDFKIKMTYRPKSLPWALGASVLMIMLLLYLCICRKRMNAKIDSWLVKAS
ncbi:YfhO family protein [Pseudomonas atacamensis]|uniref:YfhO family protein n=2 Tax=Gammaproteobacteria TaxID=1236 RepID=UPI001C3C7D23|nr:YfhO family protein [Pseudomonas atacamensis]QXH71576.1 YfhO family protein [Pseudomonas atacamensis]